MESNWHGLIKIIDIQHLDKNGKILWEKKNLYNVLHHQGEALILNSMFITGLVPSIYYFGLDNRSTLSESDVLPVYGEPGITDIHANLTGYSRYSASSSDTFALSIDSGTQVATAFGPVVSFRANPGYSFSGSNLFMATSGDNTGQLIASVSFGTVITVGSTEQINMRMSLSLRTC